MKGLWFTALALVAMLCVPVFAEDAKTECKAGDKSHEGKMFPMQHNMWKKLNLTDAQKEALKPLFKEMRQARMDNMKAIKDLRDKIKDELHAVNSSEATLNQLADEMGKLHTQMVQKMNAIILKVKAILSAEQFDMILKTELAGEEMRGQCPMGKDGDKPAGQCPMGKKGHGKDDKDND